MKTIRAFFTSISFIIECIGNRHFVFIALQIVYWRLNVLYNIIYSIQAYRHVDTVYSSIMYVFIGVFYALWFVCEFKSISCIWRCIGTPVLSQPFTTAVAAVIELIIYAHHLLREVRSAKYTIFLDVYRHNE